MLPIRKYIKVWIEKRKNRKSTSYTLEWVDFGRRQFQSLGKHATLAYAREAARQKERELNSPERHAGIDPITWEEFKTKYFKTFYPGHDLPVQERKAKEREWSKCWGTLKRERLAIEGFNRLVKPRWCHEITAEDRESFIQKRLPEVGSVSTVNTELRALRHICNIMEEWKHRPEGSNPFAGRGKATVGNRRKRRKEQGQIEKAKHYTFQEVKAILVQATKEANEEPTFGKKRLLALIYFVAYTGCRINEALHLEWDDIDWEKGIAWIFFKIENDLKTEGSQAPFGLPERLLTVLREWEKDKTCSWVFSNSENKPWTSGGPGYRPFDQLKELAKRAGVQGANFLRFRHSFSTHGKQRFGLTKEQWPQLLVSPSGHRSYSPTDANGARTNR